jgi:hypothetical protein
MNIFESEVPRFPHSTNQIHNNITPQQSQFLKLAQSVVSKMLQDITTNKKPTQQKYQNED